MVRAYHNLPVVIFILLNVACLTSCHALTRQSDPAAALQTCQRNGWSLEILQAGGLQRSVLWQAPRRSWQHGAIIVLHGGGGSHYHFCAGGRLVQPQIEFARQAVAQGFAVFLLDATTDVVTDENGRQCGKRFDFSVLHRANVDLPYIGKVIKEFIPSQRPHHSSRKVFMTGLSTGGYMTIRAATHFAKYITAFAPVSAGDPYGTATNCDARLSRRQSAKGILLDLETGKQIIEPGACRAKSYANEKRWESSARRNKPAFKQFHNQGDAIVDISCMQKAGIQLRRHGYRDAGAYILRADERKALNHVWLKRYNQPILDFFRKE
jgi:pimeloyl-ACP methyl ester carboxylesterase